MPKTKNLLVFALVIALVLPVVIHASQDKDKSAEEPQKGKSIEALQKQIEKLEEQLSKLKEQVQLLQSGAAVEEEEEEENGGVVIVIIKSDIFTKFLRKGLKNEEIEDLQAFLAELPDIYPEGLITGFFGTLTEKAIKKFQKKYNEDDDGIVGPKTRKILNWRVQQLLTEGAGKSGKIPPGLLHAPGIQKKIATSTPSTPDITPPVISDIQVISITYAAATIAWTTDEKSDSKVNYATTSPLASTTPLEVTNSSKVIGHSINLIGLEPETTYYYVVFSKDDDNNTATSIEQSFTTLATPDITTPVISNIQTTNIASTTATVTWDTNEVSGSKVNYATTSPVSSASNIIEVSDSADVTSHSLDLSGLTASTTYYYFVTSMDPSNNTATSSDHSFTTISP